MVYCAAFYCNGNSSKNKVTCSWFKFPIEPTLFKKANIKLTKHTTGFVCFDKTCFDCDPDHKMW